MRVSELSVHEIGLMLQTSGINLTTGPFVYRIKSSLSDVAKAIKILYQDFLVSIDHNFADFHIRIDPPNGFRRWFRPQANFYFDNTKPFSPMAVGNAVALLEWGMNWCVSTYVNQYLKIHAAVLEKDGMAVIMPGSPGAGKSTLCAGLMLKGWRLLSDELALVSFDAETVTPTYRPVSLKNESIDVISGFDTEAVLGPVVKDTHKGTVAHLKINNDDVNSIVESKPACIIFPKYKKDTEQKLTPCPKAAAFIKTAENSFNYSMLGEQGFKTMTRLIDRCDCYYFKYSDLTTAIAEFNALEPWR